MEKELPELLTKENFIFFFVHTKTLDYINFKYNIYVHRERITTKGKDRKI
jgi:hypothetical protein